MTVSIVLSRFLGISPKTRNMGCSNKLQDEALFWTDCHKLTITCLEGGRSIVVFLLHLSSKLERMAWLADNYSSCKTCPYQWDCINAGALRCFVLLRQEFIYGTHISNSTYNALSLHPQEQTQGNIVYCVTKHQCLKNMVPTDQWQFAKRTCANCQWSVTISPQC